MMLDHANSKYQPRANLNVSPLARTGSIAIARGPCLDYSAAEAQHPYPSLIIARILPMTANGCYVLPKYCRADFPAFCMI